MVIPPEVAIVAPFLTIYFCLVKRYRQIINLIQICLDMISRV